MVRLALRLALAACLLPAAARAADGPVGIAFAQAEEGTWWCRDADSGKAIACALALCARQAGGQDCRATRWCLPAGWSGLMMVWLPEFHVTEIACGLPDQPAVGRILQAVCDAGTDFTRCDFVQVIDPDGDGNDVTDVHWPGPAAASGAE